MTLSVGVEMSFLGYQDVEARTGWCQAEDDLDAEPQNAELATKKRSRYQKET